MWKNRQVHPGDKIDLAGISESRVASMRRLRYITDDRSNVPIGPQSATPVEDMNVAELRELADRLGIDHDGVKKAALRQLLTEKSVTDGV